MEHLEIISKDSDETVSLGETIGRALSGGETVALYGELGSGKTQLVKGMARGLGIDEDIISPTFVIRRDYVGKNLRLYHYDFYRIDAPEGELVEGLREAETEKDAATVIEWAQRVAGSLPGLKTEIYLEYISENERKIKFKFADEKLQKSFLRIKEEILQKWKI